jgi:alkanesulfonate monooxygenase SsuD/methylene tetrahydromethanopterin reductase-like flavin-dependent oxidoreductase (luciferase family)
MLVLAGRRPEEVRRSLMTGTLFGRDEATVAAKLKARNRTAAELRDIGVAVGPGSAIVDQLGQWREAGVQRIMLQWLDQDDIDGLEALAAAVLPQVR